MAGFSHIFSDRQCGRSNSWLSLERSSWALTRAPAPTSTHSAGRTRTQTRISHRDVRVDGRAAGTLPVGLARLCISGSSSSVRMIKCCKRRQETSRHDTPVPLHCSQCIVKVMGRS